MYLIAGLGNPGRKFEMTRHNLGFRAIDALAQAQGVRVQRAKFRSLAGETVISGEKTLLLKPQTFMNLSGYAIREAVAYYAIPPEQLIVIYDDIDLPVGALRIRKFGGPGTHKGMKSVIAQLGTQDFPRIRIGVGASSGPLVDYVIGQVPAEEQAKLEHAAGLAAAAAADIVALGIDLAMNRHNCTHAELYGDA